MLRDRGIAGRQAEGDPLTGKLQERSRGTASRLLTTMAIVRANADADKDYISNFEPFATDCLKGWEVGEEVGPEALTAAICNDWGVPSLPTAVGRILLHRAEQRDEVIKAGSSLFPNIEQLAEVPGLAGEKHEMLARMSALGQAVVRYANEVHGLEWSAEDAASGLERLAEEFGAELAMAKRSGVLADTDLSEDEVLAVVYGFARYAIESDPMNFRYLEEMVQGTMLVNAVYFPDAGHVSNKLKTLRVYLDTTPILRALGLAADQVSAATNEMLALLRDEFKVRMFVFPHTVNEIEGVLDRTAGALRRGTSRAATQADGSGRNREAIDALVGRGATAGEIEALQAELETRLLELGVRVTETPSHREQGHIDEERFDAILNEVVAYKSESAREKDLRSLAAVDRLRGKALPRDLSQANALFVTANAGVVQAGREFFGEAERRARVPHAMHETAFTAQLWVRAPHPPPDLPRKLLIADCFAALNPPPELWERWIRHIIRLQERGQVTEEQVQNLIYHQQAKIKLFEVTQGNPHAVGDETVAEVLDRFEAELQGAAGQEAAAEHRQREKSEAERDALHREVEDLRREKEEEAKVRWRRAREKGRTVIGYGFALAIALGFPVAAFGLGAIHGRLAWAVVITLVVLASTASWAWGARRSWKFPFAALIFAGAATALFFNVLNVAPEDRTHATSGPARESR